MEREWLACLYISWLSMLWIQHTQHHHYHPEARGEHHSTLTGTNGFLIEFVRFLLHTKFYISDSLFSEYFRLLVVAHLFSIETLISGALQSDSVHDGVLLKMCHMENVFTFPFPLLPPAKYPKQQYNNSLRLLYFRSMRTCVQRALIAFTATRINENPPRRMSESTVFALIFVRERDYGKKEVNNCALRIPNAIAVVSFLNIQNVSRATAAELQRN